VRIKVPQSVDLAPYGFPGCKVDYNVFVDHTQGERNNARDYAVRQALRGLMSTPSKLILPATAKNGQW